MGFTQREASVKLGIAVCTVSSYDRGERYNPPGRVDVPLFIRLAAAAIENNLSPVE